MFGYLVREANNSPVIGILIGRTSNKGAIHTGQLLHLAVPRSTLDCKEHQVQKEDSHKGKCPESSFRRSSRPLS
jgi:hypothetical protein